MICNQHQRYTPKHMHQQKIGCRQLLQSFEENNNNCQLRREQQDVDDPCNKTSTFLALESTINRSRSFILSIAVSTMAEGNSIFRVAVDESQNEETVVSLNTRAASFPYEHSTMVLSWEYNNQLMLLQQQQQQQQQQFFGVPAVGRYPYP